MSEIPYIGDFSLIKGKTSVRGFFTVIFQLPFRFWISYSSSLEILSSMVGWP